MFEFSKYYESTSSYWSGKKPELKKELFRAIKDTDIPEGPHFVILGIYQSQYTIPGDERSRTNPGHGYPESTVTTNNVEYWICKNETVWKEVIAEFYEYESKQNSYRYDRKTIVPLKVEGKAKVKPIYSVEIS